MADQQTLAIVITAENAQAVASLNQLRTDLAKFEKGLKNAFDSSEVLKFSKSIEDTKRKMEVLNASLSPITNGTKGLAAGGNQAASALQNLGRVSSDLPFGLMGIQNNLNPLLESFQRLKAETGSGKEAIKALGSSLIGAGGLGLALSVVSSAILIYQNGIAGFNKKTKEAEQSVNEFTDSGVLKAVEGVRSLEREIKKAKEGLISKDGVLKHYNETIGATTGLVNNLDEAELKLKQNAPDYIKMQLAKAAANLALAESAKIELEIAELQQKQTQDFGKAGKFGAGISSAPGFVPGGDLGMKARSDANAAEKKRLEAELQKKLSDKKSIYEKFAKQNDAIMAAHPEWDFFGDNGKGKGKAGSPGSSSNIAFKQVKVDPRPLQEMVAVNAELKERLTLLSAISDQMQKQAQKEKEKAFFNIGGVAPQKTQALAAFDQKEAENKQRLLGIEQSRLDVIANINNKFKEQKALAETIGGAFQNLFQNIANGANPFETLSNAVKQLVVDLAAAAAKMFLIKAIMTAINPAAGAAKGAGGILGSLIGGITPFATGGIVSRPTLGMVGEAGTEAILPLDRFQGMLAQSFQMGSVSGNSGGTQTIVLDTQVRGNDLWFIQRRTDFNRGLKTGG